MALHCFYITTVYDWMNQLCALWARSWELLGSDRASSSGYIVRWVEAPSNKLLTTAFEASLESAAVTLQAKRRQQDNRDSY